jgi:hypothetical protein
MKVKLFAPLNIIILVLFSVNAIGQIDKTIHYQGYMTDNDGVSMPDGTYKVKFLLFEAEDATDALWSESTEVTTHAGYFNAYLGLVNPFDSVGLKFDRTYYFSMQIDSDNEELLPRRRLAAVPYSFTTKKIEFPYVDTIKTDVGIVLHKPGNGTALEVNARNGISGLFTNFNENSMVPVVQVQDSGRGYSLYADAMGFRTAAAYFTTSHSTNRRPTVEMVNYGLGNALYVANENKADTMPVISMLNQSQGYTQYIQTFSIYASKPAIYLNAFGNGGGAEYRILKTDNTQPVILSNTWGTGSAGIFNSYNTKNNQSVIKSTNYGDGPAGLFRISNETSDTSAFYAMTNGLGNAGEFVLDNKASFGNSIYTVSNGKGAAIHAKSNGIGRAGFFESNQDSYEPTLYAISNSAQPAIYATNSSTGPSASFIMESTNSSDGPDVLIDHKGGGIALQVHAGVNPLQPALYVKKEGVSGVAAIFDGHITINGDLKVTGNLEKLSGSFVIDHPLDPANKELVHSFVESPDMKNIYDGVVTLDNKGEATITMPDWFGVLNKDFRYLLTCIGGWAQVYISSEMKDNKFSIAGGKPGLKVSWMVTGIRKDPWAENNRIQVERDKMGSDKGKFLYEEYYGK